MGFVFTWNCCCGSLHCPDLLVSRCGLAMGHPFPNQAATCGNTMNIHSHNENPLTMFFPFFVSCDKQPPNKPKIKFECAGEEHMRLHPALTHHIALNRSSMFCPSEKETSAVSAQMMHLLLVTDGRKFCKMFEIPQVTICLNPLHAALIPCSAHCLM